MNRICILILLLFSTKLSSQAVDPNKNDLPEIGVVASDAISLDKEILVGDALMRQLRGQAAIINDPLLEEYIQDLGNRLVTQADNVKFPFEFFLINSPDINAFAFFGGHIGIHSGLIFNADTESELASVVAHEISHVTQRHIARRIQAQQKFSPVQLASTIGGVLIALANPEAGMAAISASSAAAQQNSINFTRSNEKEADRVGIHILAQAGFDPTGAASFFGKLAQKYRHVSTPPAFLLTHPLPESRIADARSRAESYGRRQVPASKSFHLVKARIQARYFADAKRNIEYYSAALKNNKYVFQEAAKYGLALSYLKDEQYLAAERIIVELHKQDRENLFYLDTLADVAIALEKYDLAIVPLSEQNLKTPRNRVISLNLANLNIEKGNYHDATVLLKDYLLVNPDHLLAHDLLSTAYGENQQKLEMHQTKAEVYALVSAYPSAIDELHSAYNFAGERKLEKQRIRARIEQLREAQHRLKTL